MPDRSLEKSAASRPHHRFLLVRLSSLGDVIHALPAASALRDAFPDAQIDWVIDARWQRLLEGNPDLSEVIAFDRKQAGALSSLIRKLRAAQYTCAIDFQGLYKSALLALASGAPRRIGFQSSYAREGLVAGFYTDRLNPHGPHKVDHNRTLVERAGARLGPPRFPLAIRPEDDEVVTRELQEPRRNRFLRAESRRRLALEMLARGTLRRTSSQTRTALRLARRRHIRARRRKSCT